ncbi:MULTISPECIES: J domain-containing protein [Cyanophyceae]|uniref:J domain-containing protein n=1 Tax=Cyanophyceae TaxID=3028117 RepID=UPI000C07E5A3|nr:MULTISPECIES: J domain-containing protein [Cyanophyceae]QCS50273.1 molecular chaperone DnaJ [Picosynechococcus sp. PCC 11901]
MTTPDYYKVLNISPKATQQEIKNAYRRLAKQYHPDTCDKSQTANGDRIVALNHAYEILGDAHQRKQYDLSRDAANYRGIRSAQGTTVRPRQTMETDLDVWLQHIYRPLNQAILKIIKPLEAQIDELAADPFDDDLMATFQTYLEDCQAILDQAQKLFQSLPNPANVARAARDLYYCLNHLGDGLEQLEWFTLNYNEEYLHSGQEMFRRADQFSWQAQEAIAQL